MRRLARFAVLGPLAIALLLAGRTVGRDSCTVDEFGNLPLTVVYWTHDALHVDPGNPPLTRWIQGIPLLADPPDPGADDATIAATRTSWDLGYLFEAAHFDDYHRVLVRARLGSLALLLLAVAGVFVWARRLAGTGPALAAAGLAAVSPNLMAHGRLVTPDVGLAAFVVWAGWAMARAMDAEGTTAARSWAVAAGGLAGAAALAKFSGLLMLPAGAIALAAALGAGWRRRVEGPALLLGAALLGLHAAYGFPGFGAWGGVPTPLPATVLDGIRAQLIEPPYPAYLLGEMKLGGWLRYYPVALLVKVPGPALALFLLAAVTVVAGRDRRFVLPLALAIVFFVALGLFTRKNVGVRYLLPMLPLLHVVTAAVFASPRRPLRTVGLVLLALAVVSGVGASAHPLAYFNGAERLAGGKRAVLADSNLDWGQALPDLREWMTREGVETVQLAYFGRVDPSVYGIRWRTLKTEPVEGAVAIGATLAVGRPYVVRMKRRPMLAESELAWSEAGSWAWLDDLVPDAELGGGAMLVWKDVGAARRAAEARATAAGAAGEGDR